MYDKETVRNTNKLFYTSFGRYISGFKSSNGSKIKWINYDTGIKGIFVRINANQQNAIVSIDVQHKDADIRELQYEQFLQLRPIFTNCSETDWSWNKNFTNANNISFPRIYSILPQFNIYEKSQWKLAFEFYKKALLHFDVFWCDYKELFLQLQ